MWVALMAIGALSGLVIFNCAFYVLERFLPFTYRSVPFDGVLDHFQEFIKRGFARSQMVVTDETTGKTFRLRKDYRVGEGAVQLAFVLDEAVRGTEFPEECRQRLIAAGHLATYGVFPRGWTAGLGRKPAFGGNIACCCNAEGTDVADIAQFVCWDLYALTPSSRFRVWVKGNITGWERRVWGRESAAEIRTAFGRAARPYKRWHMREPGSPPSLSRRLGMSLGKIFRWLFR